MLLNINCPEEIFFHPGSFQIHISASPTSPSCTPPRYGPNNHAGGAIGNNDAATPHCDLAKYVIR
jgi:hypothetical protein